MDIGKDTGILNNTFTYNVKRWFMGIFKRLSIPEVSIY